MDKVPGRVREALSIEPRLQVSCEEDGISHSVGIALDAVRRLRPEANIGKGSIAIRVVEPKYLVLEKANNSETIIISTPISCCD